MIYEFNYNLISLIDFLSLIQGIVIGVILILSSTKKRPSQLLGLFIISFSLEVLDVLLFETGIIEEHPDLLFLPINFYFLSIPLLYLYTKNLIEKLSIKKSIIILLPGMIEFVVVLVLFLFPASEKLNLIDSIFIRTFTEIYDYISILFSIFFALLIINLIKKHRVNANNFYSDLKWKKLNWINYITYYILIQFILILIFSFFPIYDDIFSFVCSIINLILIYWVGISGLYQLKVESSIETPEGNHIGEENIRNKPSIEKSRYDNTFSKLLLFIKEKKPYKEHDLTLDTLSKQSGISKRELSRIINKNANTNFNMFINEFRVNEAKQLLANVDYNHFNIQGIAFEAGFKSKATFYAVFKKIVGKTPNEYKLKSNK